MGSRRNKIFNKYPPLKEKKKKKKLQCMYIQKL